MVLNDARQERLKHSKPYYLFQRALLGRLSRLSHKKIRVSDPAGFNDPLDLKLVLEDRIYLSPFEKGRLREALRVLIEDNQKVGLHWFFNGQLLEYVRHWIDETVDSFTLVEKIKERFQEFGVACFTPDWQHGLMWSHYADSHTGYCIEYCVREMDLVKNNQGLFAAFHVQYSSTLPELCISEALFSPHQTLGRMLATKSAEWAYEQEWRLVHLEEKATHVDMPAGMEVSALIAGQKAKPELVQKLIKKATTLKVPVYQARRDDSGYPLRMVLL
jgi:hypothetical protein